MSGMNCTSTKDLTSSDICSILEKLRCFKSAKLKFCGLELEVSMENPNQVVTPVYSESSVGGGTPDPIIPLNKQESDDVDDVSLIALSPEDFEERELAGEFNEEPRYSETE